MHFLNLRAYLLFKTDGFSNHGTSVCKCISPHGARGGTQKRSQEPCCVPETPRCGQLSTRHAHRRAMPVNAPPHDVTPHSTAASPLSRVCVPRSFLDDTGVCAPRRCDLECQPRGTAALASSAPPRLQDLPRALPACEQQPWESGRRVWGGRGGARRGGRRPHVTLTCITIPHHRTLKVGCVF